MINYEVIKDNKRIIKRFYSDSFDFRKILLLEEDPQMRHSGRVQNLSKKQVSMLAILDSARMTGKVEIISYTPNKITISVSTDRPGLLFLSDSYYPAWKAKVNDKEEKIYRADYAFRAVMVPAGKSKVEFEYRLF